MASPTPTNKLEDILFKSPLDANRYPLLSSDKVVIPLEVKACNGICPTPFSDARFTLEYKKGTFMCIFFREQWLWIYSVIANELKDESGIVKSLKDFFENENHKRCLESLTKLSKVTHKQAVLAAHLFGPLSAESACIINENHFNEDLKTCPGCTEALVLGDTTFGNKEIWYGYADMLVNKSAVKVDMLKKRGDAGSECEDVECGEQDNKRQKLCRADITCAETHDHDMTTDKEFQFKFQSSRQNVVDVKQGIFPFYHSLAQTIVNAFLQAKNPALEKMLIPSFYATETHIQVQMYCRSNDLLIVSEELPLFDQDTGEFDVSTIIYLWLALNIDVPGHGADLKGSPSNFKRFVENHKKNQTYINNIEKPLHLPEREAQKPVYRVSPMLVRDFDRTISRARKIFKAGNKTLYGGN